MQISARGDYAVRAALSLAVSHPRLRTAQSIAEEQRLPYKYLEAVLADLRRAGLVRSQRGAEGGYLLAVAPEEVTVGQVLRAVDGPLAEVRGVRPEQTSYDGSAAHLPTLWVAVRAAVRDVVDQVTLAQLASGRMPARVRRLTTPPDAWQPR